jgi:hypothetical protein
MKLFLPRGLRAKSATASGTRGDPILANHVSLRQRVLLKLMWLRPPASLFFFLQTAARFLF